MAEQRNYGHQMQPFEQAAYFQARDALQTTRPSFAGGGYHHEVVRVHREARYINGEVVITEDIVTSSELQEVSGSRRDLATQPSRITRILGF